MIKRENGLTLLESLVALSIVGVIGAGLTTVFLESTGNTQTSNDRMMTVQQVENAGNWLSRDARAAEHITVLSYPNMVQFTWTEWTLNPNGASTATYFTATYAFVNMTDGVGKLRRTLWSSAGANAQTTIGQYVYYNAGDPGNTTFAILQDPLLTVQMTSKFKDAQETRVFQVVHRVTI